MGLIDLRRLAEWSAQLELGSVGEWVSGVGTVAAVVVALRIGQRDWRRADDERRDAEAAQARLITTTSTHQGGAQVAVQTVNQSQFPIIALTLKKVAAKPPYDGGGWRWNGGTRLTQEILNPGETATWAVLITDANGDPVDPGPYHVDCGAEISFTDYAGLLWRRVDLDQPGRVVERWRDKL